MFNFGILINKFYDIFNKQQTIFEIILNLSFILILFIIGFIFYWDSINRNVINTSRCKAIIRNDDATYTANFYNDKNTKNEKLFSISYDNSRNHNVKISCEGVCNKSSSDPGVIPSTFSIPYFNYKEQNIDDTFMKKCYCDKQYTVAIEQNSGSYSSLGIDGDEFLSDYYKDFYNIGGAARGYTSKLFFPA